MADTDSLRDMIDNFVNDNPDQARVDFHTFMKGKIRDELGLPDHADNQQNSEED